MRKLQFPPHAAFVAVVSPVHASLLSRLSVATTQGWFDGISACNQVCLWLAVGRQGVPIARAIFEVWLAEVEEVDRIIRELDTEDLAREELPLFFAGW